jgi:hypothetical protein
VNLKSAIDVAQHELREGVVPGDMAVVDRAPVVVRDPASEKFGAVMIAAGLVEQVTVAVGGNRIARPHRERSLHQRDGTLEIAELFVAHAAPAHEPPVVAVCGRECLVQRKQLVLLLRPAAKQC